MKHAWIIGGSEGIGLQVALQLQNSGWLVTVSSRSSDRLAQLSKEHGLQTRRMDATDEEQVMETVESCFANPDLRPELVLINIGDYEPMPIEHISSSLFERLNETNYLAPMRLLVHLLPHMRDNGGGTIWVNASLAAYRGLPRSAPYNASKAATLSMVESLRAEAENWGVRLGVINHGFVRTRLTRKNNFYMPGLIEPDEAARHIVNGMNKSGFEITFPFLFTLWMKLLRSLPYAIYFPLTRRLV